MTRNAAFALLGHSALLMLGLVAYFKVEPQPWGWASMVALLCAALGIAAAVLVWRLPSRTHLAAGAAVVVMSLTRLVGSSFGWTTLVLLVITGALLVPVARAFLMLPAGET